MSHTDIIVPVKMKKIPFMSILDESRTSHYAPYSNPTKQYPVPETLGDEEDIRGSAREQKGIEEEAVDKEEEEAVDKEEEEVAEV